jgi:hypothetical protein
MKIKTLCTLTAAAIVSTLFVFSTAAADETRWQNPHEFIGGQNAKVSHGSALGYPGSIIVDVVVEPPPVVEPPVEPPVDPPVDPPAVEPEILEIVKEFGITESYALTGVTVCFREYEATFPFTVKIYEKGVPAVDPTTGVISVMDDTLVAGDDTFQIPMAECTVIPLTSPIMAAGNPLLLGIGFESAATETAIAAIVSAVGLSEMSLSLDIDGCDTTIPNIEVEPGVMFSDVVDACAAGAKNHGKFVSCVSKAANGLKKAGIISGSEKGRITSCAAQSSLP